MTTAPVAEQGRRRRSRTGRAGQQREDAAERHRDEALHAERRGDPDPDGSRAEPGGQHERRHERLVRQLGRQDHQQRREDDGEVEAHQRVTRDAGAGARHGSGRRRQRPPLGEDDLDRTPGRRARPPRTSSCSGWALTTTPSRRATFTRIGHAARPRRCARSRSRACLPTTCSRSPIADVSRKTTARTARGAVVGAEHGQGVRRAALLHEDRGEPGVRGAGLEQLVEDRPATPGGRGRRRWWRAPRRGSARSSSRPAGRRAAVPTTRRTTFGRAGKPPRPGSDARAGHRHRRHRTAARGDGRRGEQHRWGCTARRAPSPPKAGRPAARSSSRTAGTGTGRSPCAVRARPDPSATGETTTELEPEVHEAGGAARRRRPGRRAHPPRGSGPPRRRCRGRRPRPGPAARRRRWRGCGPARRARPPRAGRGRRAGSGSVGAPRSPRDHGLVRGEPRVDRRPYVDRDGAARARPRRRRRPRPGHRPRRSAPRSMSPLAPLEQSNQPWATARVRRGAHGPATGRWARRATRAAKTPAPNPLSMLHTTTPGAQELSIASSAASPSNEAP